MVAISYCLAWAPQKPGFRAYCQARHPRVACCHFWICLSQGPGRSHVDNTPLGSGKVQVLSKRHDTALNATCRRYEANAGILATSELSQYVRSIQLEYNRLSQLKTIIIGKMLLKKTSLGLRNKKRPRSNRVRALRSLLHLHGSARHIKRRMSRQAIERAASSHPRPPSAKQPRPGRYPQIK